MGDFYFIMDRLRIFVRVRDREELEEILLSPVQMSTDGEKDVLWESKGAYYLEAYQCGVNPSICSIEKDLRIESSKEEIALLLMDEINNHSKIAAG